MEVLVPPLDADLCTNLEMTLCLAVMKLFRFSTEDSTSCEDIFPEELVLVTPWFCLMVPALAVFACVVEALPGSCL